MLLLFCNVVYLLLHFQCVYCLLNNRFYFILYVVNFLVFYNIQCITVMSCILCIMLSGDCVFSHEIAQSVRDLRLRCRPHFWRLGCHLPAGTGRDPKNLS